MRIAFFDTHHFEREVFEDERSSHEITYFEERLTAASASRARSFPCVCAFANDTLDAATLKILASGETRLIALRSAGYNHVDLKAAKALGLAVVRVPEYSPYAIAEHVVALILTLNRKIHRAHNRVREGNFSLEGLVGFDLHGKTVGIVGLGRIGKALGKIMAGFGCQVLFFDKDPQESYARMMGHQWVTLKELYQRSDIVSLHVPLTAETKDLVDENALGLMKKGVMLINTGRGKLVQTKALINALKVGQVGFAGLDVYEEEEGIFFQDRSGEALSDDVLARLLTFPNVLITGHQGFLTKEALTNIAQTTLKSVDEFEKGSPLSNSIG